MIGEVAVLIFVQESSRLLEGTIEDYDIPAIAWRRTAPVSDSYLDPPAGGVLGHGSNPHAHPIALCNHSEYTANCEKISDRAVRNPPYWRGQASGRNRTFDSSAGSLSGAIQPSATVLDFLNLKPRRSPRRRSVRSERPNLPR